MVMLQLAVVHTRAAVEASADASSGCPMGNMVGGTHQGATNAWNSWAR